MKLIENNDLIIVASKVHAIEKRPAENAVRVYFGAYHIDIHCKSLEEKTANLKTCATTSKKTNPPRSSASRAENPQK